MNEELKEFFINSRNNLTGAIGHLKKLIADLGLENKFLMTDVNKYDDATNQIAIKMHKSYVDALNGVYLKSGNLYLIVSSLTDPDDEDGWRVNKKLYNEEKFLMEYNDVLTDGHIIKFGRNIINGIVEDIYKGCEEKEYKKLTNSLNKAFKEWQSNSDYVKFGWTFIEL